MQRVTCATAYRSQCVHGGAPTGVGDRAGVRAHNRFLPLPRRLVPPVNLLSPFGFALGGHAALIAPQFYCVVLVWPLAHCALSTNTALPQAAAGSTPHDNAPCWASQQVGPLRWGSRPLRRARRDAPAGLQRRCACPTQQSAPTTAVVVYASTSAVGRHQSAAAPKAYGSWWFLGTGTPPFSRVCSSSHSLRLTSTKEVGGIVR